MRGFLAVVLGLLGLEVVLTSQLPGLASALTYPATLARAWMDPAQPLIQSKAGTSSAPQGPTNAQGEKYLPHTRPKIPGHCPPGFVWNPATGNCDMAPYHITQ